MNRIDDKMYTIGIACGIYLLFLVILYGVFLIQ